LVACHRSGIFYLGDRADDA